MMAAHSVALPGTPPRPAAHRQTQFEQTKPTDRPRIGPISDAAILAEAMACGPDDPCGVAARSAARPGAPQRSDAHRITSVEQTNPSPRGARPLTSRQLAAARLVAHGMKSAEVARRLSTIRQTVNRWKRLPAFAAELRRLHEILVREIPNFKSQIPNKCQNSNAEKLKQEQVRHACLEF